MGEMISYGKNKQNIVNYEIYDYKTNSKYP